MKNNRETAFADAASRYAELGVDVEAAMAAAAALPLSMHCWQGDDVGGFEHAGASLDGGGIQVTGNFPGKARDIQELRTDIDEVRSLVPGTLRLSLHAIYGEFGGAAADRDELEPGHFSGWMDWAKERRLALDFNATLFSHPLAASGWTLSHPEAAVRDFWIEHVRRARRVAAAMGAAQGSPCVNNTWIPDGSKDKTASRSACRNRLADSLDAIFEEKLPANLVEDSVEGKLFGIGAEYFTAGSHDFYLGYAATRRLFLTMDMGHFHPTESVADKLSAVLPFVPGVLLHLSRPVRWDSDHVLISGDELSEVAFEVVRSRSLERIRVGLDYFDASINRIGAWAIGARAARKAFLCAFLEPVALIAKAERAGDGFARLALFEGAQGLPWGEVWNELCRRQGAPADGEFIGRVAAYAANTLAARG
ncbi:MAG TPA: L-rhamnose isomerase [Rectinemataceae bacterium]|nr:L-rhamnose isomerase [Rectinemataceae bacterium]